MNESEQTSLIQRAIEGFSRALQGLREAGLLPADALDNLGDIKVVPTGVPPAAPVESAAGQTEQVPTERQMPERGPNGHFLPGVNAKVRKPHASKPKVPPAPHQVDEFVSWFFRSPLEHLYAVKCGRYECRLGVDGAAHCLFFHSESQRGREQDANNVVGIRPQNSAVGVFNASALRYSNSRDAQKRPQAAAEKAGAVPIPFQNVVAKTNGAGLDLTKLEIVDWSGSERLLIPPVTRRRDWNGEFFVVDRHFAGALVVKIEERYFLFDADREEINEFGFNPFFTHLPGPVKSIQEAYESLMPQAVKDAIKDGMAVQRQGEFFFVPCTDAELAQWFWPAQAEKATLNAWKARERVSLSRNIQDFSEVGAAQYNALQAHRFHHAGEFLKRCADHNGGMIPEGDGEVDSLHNATAVLGPFLERLCERVGSPLAQGYIPFSRENLITEALEDNYSALSYWGTNPGSSYMSPLADNLSDRFAAAVEPTTRVGSPKGGEYFMYNMMIGEAARMGGQHRATGVIIPPNNNPEGKVVLVVGAVTHSGREHRPIWMATPHRVYANLATGNFTVSGDVD